MRFFLPLQAWACGPSGPCPVIWAWSPGPAHTLLLTQGTPTGVRGALQGAADGDPHKLGETRPLPFALLPFLLIESLFCTPVPTPAPGPFLSTGPSSLRLLQLRAKTILLNTPPCSRPSPSPRGPFWAQPWAPAQLFVQESEGREGNLLECRGPREALTPKGVGPVLPVYSDTFQDL